MTGDVGPDDDRGEVLSGTGSSKRLKLLLGVPLLIDIDAFRLDRVRRDDEVPATLRPPRLHHRPVARSELWLCPEEPLSTRLEFYPRQWTCSERRRPLQHANGQ